MSWASSSLPWLSVAVGVVGLLTGFYYFRQSRARKTLDWLPLSNTSIVPRSTRAEVPDLDLIYDGRRVDNPRLVRLRLKNTGNREIAGSDFVVSPTVRFTDSRVLAAQVVAESAPDVYGLVEFDVPVSDHEREVVLDPEVLNPGDWLDLQVVVDGANEWPEVRARFSGQTRPVANIRSRAARRGTLLGVATAVSGGAGLAVSGTWVAVSDGDSGAAGYYVFPIAAAVAGMGLGLLTRRRRDGEDSG